MNREAENGLHRADAKAVQPMYDLNVLAATPLTPPRALKDELSGSETAIRTVLEARRTVEAIVRGEDTRLLVVVGPCSIHDVDAAMEYARRLVELKHRYRDRMYIMMRVYFEKPRTTVGWKGLINDPYLDGTFDMAHGIRLARKLLVEINGLGLAAGTEMLDPITPQYLDDLVSWASIGARTTESQTHRQMASGLSMPVGFKNSTVGNLQVAIDAMKSARSQHHFLGIDDEGRTCIIATRGNRWGHLILRGGTDQPNYHPENVATAVRTLKEAGLEPVVMVDCSHANSFKKFDRQEEVWESIIEQRSGGQTAIMGAMLESNLFEGNQPLSASGSDKHELRYGVSVTDACIGWEKTAQLLESGYAKLKGQA